MLDIAFRFAAACALLLSTAASAATVMVYGDSLSAGYGVAAGRDWASLLAARLREVRPDYTVANASVSGETTLGGRNRIVTALERHRPRVVIIALGANDGLRGGDLAAMRANLEAIVDASRKTGARVLLVGMRLPPNYGATYTERFHKTFSEVAASRSIPLVPFLFEGFAEDRSYFQPDTIHPSEKAQPLMLETVWKGLQPLLRKP